MRGARKFLVSVVLAILVVGFLMLTSAIGSVLNRSRGGFIHFGPSNQSDPAYNEWYWPNHVLSRLLFALPTGLLVLLFGLHCRAAFVVALMTWLSLYIGWGSYMNIGAVNNFHSRTGYLDWLVGRQGQNWTVNQRYMREYAGMSLRGLLWTAPQGYLLESLGFGWEYSLSGSLMGMTYYVGSRANLNGWTSRFLDGNIALSEILWGWFVWFLLSIVSLAQLVRRARLWIHRRNPYLGYKPYSTWEVLKYDSLNRSPFRITYEIFVLILNVLYCFSLVFYALVEQKDMRNKGQTFFGLFTAILCITVAQGWRWGTRYLIWQNRKALKRSRRRSRSVAVPGSSPPLATIGTFTPKSSLRRGQLTRSKAKYEPLQKAVARANQDGYKEYGSMRKDGEPLLTWPYSHPDRLSPTAEEGNVNAGSNRLQLPEGEPELDVRYHLQPASTSTAFLILWQNLEEWIWMDIFLWIRRFLGIIFLLNTMLLALVAVMATIQGWHYPRFMQQCSVG